jgi:hypothetical protein
LTAAVALEEDDEFPEEFVVTVLFESGVVVAFPVVFSVELESSFVEEVLPPLVSFSSLGGNT